MQTRAQEKCVIAAVIILSLNASAEWVDPWMNGNATSPRDPLYIDMPWTFAKLDPVTVTVYINDPVIKKEANWVEVQPDGSKFYSSGKPIYINSDGNIREGMDYNGESSFTVGFRDNSWILDKYDIYFSFYKVKTFPYNEYPDTGYGTELYGWQCNGASNHNLCGGKGMQCTICIKSVGTVFHEYKMLPAKGVASPPAGYDWKDARWQGADQTNPGYLEYSYSEEDKVVPGVEVLGKPVTCSESFTVQVDANYGTEDLQYLKEWHDRADKAAIAAGKTTVSMTSGPGGLASGKAVEVITSDYGGSQWDWFSASYSLYSSMSPDGSGHVKVTGARSGCVPKGGGKAAADKAISEARKFAAGYNVQPEGGGDSGFKGLVTYQVLRQVTPGGISGKITDGRGDPMPYAAVTVELGGKQYPARTDEYGTYTVSIPDLKPDANDPPTGKINVDFSYERDGKNYYNVREKQSGDKIVSVWKTFSVETEMDKTQDMDVGTKLNPDIKTNVKKNNLPHLAPIYYHLSEVTDFALTQLKANIDYKLPVDVYVGGNDGTLYSRPDSYIKIAAKDASYGSTNRPDNREYHEFCHHVLFSQWNGDGLRGPGDANHGGYINGNTGDSYTEGFAEFCAMACAKYRNEPKPEIYAGFGSMEQNYKAWTHRGYDEELAVNGILWDLYDERNDKGDTVTLPLDKMWDILKVKRADFYGYYKAFKAAFPDKADAIDKIFIEHGFFADKNAGNHVRDASEPYKDVNGDGSYAAGEPFVDYGTVEGLGKPWMLYDEGETVGKATNYERENRSSVVKLPNSYIKVLDMQVLTYKVKVHYNDPSDGEDYEYRTSAEDGLLYVAPIPEDLDATLTVEPDSVAYVAEKTYTATNKEFVEKYYAASSNQGFFDAHDFSLKPTGEKAEEPGPYETGPAAAENERANKAQETQGGVSLDLSKAPTNSLLLAGAGAVMAGLGGILLMAFIVMSLRTGKK